MRNVTLPSAIRKQPLLAPFQEQPYLRLLPADIDVNGFIDAYKREYNNYLPRIRSGVGSSEFMRKFGQGLIGIEHIEGNQYINLRDSDYNTVYTLDNCEDATNGDWVAIGSTTGITFDTTNRLVGNASVSFTTPATTADFGISKGNFQDIATFTDRKYITMQVYFPQYITGVKIRYGTNSNNYYEVSATTDINGKRFTTGWNTVAFDLSTKTTTGVIGNDNITYFAYIISDDITTVPADNFRIDSIYLTDSYIYDLKYYSNSVVVDQWGTRRLNNLIASDTDILLLDRAELQLFLMQFSVTTSIDFRVDNGGSEWNAYQPKLLKAYDTFNMEYPSQKIIFSSEY